MAAAAMLFRRGGCLAVDSRSLAQRSPRASSGGVCVLQIPYRLWWRRWRLRAIFSHGPTVVRRVCGCS